MIVIRGASDSIYKPLMVHSVSFLLKTRGHKMCKSRGGDDWGFIITTGDEVTLDMSAICMIFT